MMNSFLRKTLAKTGFFGIHSIPNHLLLHVKKEKGPKMTGTLLAMQLAAVMSLQAPAVELLWPGGAPAAVGSEDKDKPTLTIFLPPADKSNGAAVVVCPGGGYQALAVDHEGKQIAEWLNQRGVAAFML